MQTFLYNTSTGKREGPIREGRYLIDGVPATIPQDWVELTITRLPDPLYNSNTQTLEYTEYADLDNFLWIQKNYIRDLTHQEIEDRKPKPPTTCTPRQFRLSLINSNISIQTIETMLNSIQDVKEREIALVEWEYSLEIKREHPLISSFASQLGISESQLDDIFILANTYD